MYARILQLAGHSVIYGLGSVAAKIIAIVLLPIIIRYLPPQSYGIAEAVLMIDLFAAALFRLGLQNAMMRFAYDAPKDQRDAVQMRVIQTSLALTLISTLLGVMLLIAFAHPLAAFFLNNAQRDEYIWLAALGLFSTVVYSTLTATFRIQKRPQAFLMVSLGNVLCSSGLSLHFITNLKWGVKGLLLGNFFGYLAMVPIIILLQKRLVIPRIDPALVKPMLRFAIPTIPLAVAFQSLVLIDRTIISRTEGLDALGIYGVAARFAAVVMLFVTALQLSWQPFAYSIKDDDEARRSYAIVTSWFAAVMGWIVAGLALLADPVVHVLTVPAYYHAAKIVPLLALATGIYGAYFLVGIGASRVKRTGWHAAVAAGGVAASLVANLLLIPVLGVLGAAISSVVANATLAGLMLARSQHVFYVRYEYTRIARAVLLLSGAIALAYVLPSGAGAASWLSRLGVALVWPLMLVATGFVTRAERERIIRLITRHRAGVGSGSGTDAGTSSGSGAGTVERKESARK